MLNKHCLYHLHTGTIKLKLQGKAEQENPQIYGGCRLPHTHRETTNYSADIIWCNFCAQWFSTLNFHSAIIRDQYYRKISRLTLHFYFRISIYYLPNNIWNTITTKSINFAKSTTICWFSDPREPLLLPLLDPSARLFARAILHLYTGIYAP